MNLLHDELLGHGGIDTAIRATITIYGTPRDGNPFHTLRRHVDGTAPIGRRIIARLTDLGNQWSERERARADREALARKY